MTLITIQTINAHKHTTQHETTINIINSLDETLYGMRKRLKFILSILATYPEKCSILDVGCGTGEFVTSPIASLGYNILGIDTDKASINRAKGNNKYSNCRFELKDVSSIEKSFDVIILSEVLEHIPEPLPFLKNVTDKLTQNGTLIVTVPNGHGPFELEMRLWRNNFLFGTMKAAGNIRRFLKRYLLGRTDVRNPSPAGDNKKDSLNIDCGHINFFRYREIKTLISNAGLQIMEFRNRTVFCGPYSGILFNYSKSFHKLNAFLADVLPAFLVSDWMFAVKKVSRS